MLKFALEYAQASKPTPTMATDLMNERNWRLLLEAVDEERVVPIVGDGLVRLCDEAGQLVPVNEYLLRELPRKFGWIGTCNDLAEVEDLIRDWNRQKNNVGNTTDIYYEVYDSLQGVDVRVSPFLVNLCKTGHFPLILTTSYQRRLDSLLGIGRNRVVSYNKKPGSDIRPSQLSGQAPTLFYLFGRLGMAKGSFKVTEDDLLDYLHCWHDSELRPRELGQYMADKFLLVLGCDYPDWLFRFFWNGLRGRRPASGQTDMQGVVTVPCKREEADEDLMRFLSRMRTTVYSHAEDFLRELLTRYEAHRQEDEPVTTTELDGKGEQGEGNQDIFISYASEDVNAAQEVASRLRKLGASTWLDKSALVGGEKYDRTIESKIRACRRFVPILSRTCLKPGRRYFKKEWSLAIDEALYKPGEPFITPIVIDDTDVFSQPAIPQEFQQAHIIRLDAPDLDRQLTRIIRSFR